MTYIYDRRGDWRHTLCYDLDGTLVTNAWPEIGDWQPGAVEAVKLLRDEHGVHGVVHSARLSPYDPYTHQERNPATVIEETMRVRELLDSKGLEDVDIWTLPGKPGASVYIDDKAIWYPGRPGSWKRMIPKILNRLDREPRFPVFRHDDLR